MPTEEFPGVPPFPDTVPTAPLLRISLAKLLTKDEAEEDRLWNACCDLGFFYLDLSGGEGHHGANGTNGHANGHANGTNGVSGREKTKVDGSSLLNDANALFEVAKEFFELPVEEKIKYDFADQGSYFGYVF